MANFNQNENKQERKITVWDEETHQLHLKEGKLFTSLYECQLFAGTSKYFVQIE